jgi:hypothetical protein
MAGEGFEYFKGIMIETKKIMMLVLVSNIDNLDFNKNDFPLLIASLIGENTLAYEKWISLSPTAFSSSSFQHSPSHDESDTRTRTGRRRSGKSPGRRSRGYRWPN